MELPAEVMIHNELLGLKGTRAQLIQIDANGFYEVKLKFGSNFHRVLLPMEHTVVIQAEPEVEVAADFEIER